jgi:energy-coupling factor transporter ATP-binding protein EcfA2
MQIHRLKLSGFKSFVEPATLRIEPGLTGVVGPNGCGKSNLLEAIRWVMGETSREIAALGRHGRCHLRGHLDAPPARFRRSGASRGIDATVRNWKSPAGSSAGPAQRLSCQRP